MQKPKMMPAAAPDSDSSKSAVTALARACELLEAGDLADAAKWAAIAASLGEAESIAQSA
jgi:hypothetical protein